MLKNINEKCYYIVYNIFYSAHEGSGHPWYKSTVGVLEQKIPRIKTSFTAFPEPTVGKHIDQGIAGRTEVSKPN